MNGQLLYLAISVAAIGVMVGVCVVLFGRGLAALDPHLAQTLLQDDVPGFRLGAVALSTDGRTALAEDLRNHALYLIAVRGDGYVTRQISRSYIKAATRDGAFLALRFSDFTFPKASLAFADEHAARDWEERLKAA